jgi:mycothiol system anti-sigma-R factor
MSCGKPHDVDCHEILQRMYVFLDDELETASCAEIRQHLDECAPCLEIYDVERVVKQMVHRCCGDEHAPDSLREKVRMRITEIRLEVRTQE